jgi:hypothetical protein
MRHRYFVVVASLVAAACASPAAPTQPAQPAQPAQPLSVAGTWTGTSTDSQGVTVITLQLTQTGSTVSGTVATRAPDPNDGSCNACHRNKSGTFQGTLTGTTLAMTMAFAAGADGDPTPICSATMSGAAPGVTAQSLAGEFTGSDTCEGAFLDGKLTLRR